MIKLLLTLVFAIISFSTIAKNNPITEAFVADVKRAAETDGAIQKSIDIVCPAPSASGTFLLTEANYEFGKSKGTYVFDEGKGPNAKLDWIGAKTQDDDFSSEELDGYEFGFTMPNGQFFLTVNKTGKIKAGVNVNGTSGVKEVNCKLSSQ